MIWDKLLIVSHTSDVRNKVRASIPNKKDNWIIFLTISTGVWNIFHVYIPYWICQCSQGK